jgi:hypothetical protein
MELIDIGKSYIFTCPHCEGQIEVDKTQVNCAIFRHAIYKKNLNQVNPHLDKEVCDKLVQDDSVYGCCKPFRINVDRKIVEICDYI